MTIGTWQDVRVHSYDDDGACWFTDLALGPEAKLDRVNDSSLFFEDITYRELVKCPSQHCSEDYQPLFTNAAEGLLNTCKICKTKLSSFGTMKVVLYIFL